MGFSERFFQFLGNSAVAVGSPQGEGIRCVVGCVLLRDKRKSALGRISKCYGPANASRVPTISRLHIGQQPTNQLDIKVLIYCYSIIYSYYSVQRRIEVKAIGAILGTLLLGIGSAGGVGEPIFEAMPELQPDLGFERTTDSDDMVSIADGLYTFLIENGASVLDADRIADDFLEGELPDSANGADPVSSYDVESSGGVTTRTVYPDGSISITFQQREPLTSGMSSPYSISGCSVSVGSGFRSYSNCAVFGGNGLVGMGFHASYTLVDGAYDYISGYRAPYQQCHTHVCDVPYLAGTRLREDSQGKAWVVYYMRSTIGSAASRTSSLSLLVGANSATDSFQY